LQARALAALARSPQSAGALRTDGIDADVLARLAAKGWIAARAAVPEPPRPPARYAPWPASALPDLTPEQRAVLDAIEADRASGGFRRYLLHGVTGSGKTEVYLRLIAAELAADRQTLLLVPEIGLTPQLVGRLRARFGDELAILHSGLTELERFTAWRRAH